MFGPKRLEDEHFFRLTRPGFVIPIQDSTAPSKVVGITEHKGRLFVALETGVFVRGEDDVLRPLKFSTLDDGAND
jgi:hypothetical protein